MNRSAQHGAPSPGSPTSYRTAAAEAVDTDTPGMSYTIKRDEFGASIGRKGMAKSATKGSGKASGAGSRKAADKTSKAGGASPKAAPRKAVAVRSNTAESDNSGREQEGNKAAELFIKLLQSPIVADLLAVAATAALAALAEHGFNRAGADGDSKRAGKAVKAAGKAAASAIGRRLKTEVDEIRKAAKGASGAEA
jgi:hypothetical protein